jgi:hypothetical protein
VVGWWGMREIESGGDDIVGERMGVTFTGTRRGWCAGVRVTTLAVCVMDYHSISTHRVQPF